MTHAVHTRSSTQRYTIGETEADYAEQVVVARTKRYGFYWLLADQPVLLAVRDYDGTDVTGSVDPPDGMAQRVARH